MKSISGRNTQIHTRSPRQSRALLSPFSGRARSLTLHTQKLAHALSISQFKYTSIPGQFQNMPPTTTPHSKWKKTKVVEQPSFVFDSTSNEKGQPQSESREALRAKPPSKQNRVMVVERPPQMMSPNTRPCIKRVRPQVVQQPPQTLFGSAMDDAFDTQPGLSRPRMDLSSHHIAKGQPIMNEHDTPSSEDAAVNKRKRVRGPTSMPKIWGQPPDELMVVSFNAFGQPNDKSKTSTLAHFLGTIARNGRYCPLHYNDWRVMPQCYKDEMLKTIKTKFDLQPGQKSYILKSINKKWKSWKSHVKNLILNPEAPLEQLKNVLDRVDEDQLGTLMKHWMLNKSKEMCEKNRQARAELKLFHLMGKKSFALLREIMKDKLGRYPTRAELFAECYFKKNSSIINLVVKDTIDEMEQLEEQHSHSPNTDGGFPKSDTFAKVMGPDKNGHVRMFGLGVTCADVYGIIPSRHACYRMTMEYKEKYDALKQGRPSVTGHNDAPDFPQPSSNIEVPFASVSLSRHIRVHSYVVLKSLVEINENIARGYVKEMGNVRVNGVELGLGWCEVIIQSLVNKDVRLLHPYDHIQTIGDSLGAPVAWPLSLVHLVALDLNDD